MNQEMKDLLYLIYEEIKEVKLRVTNLESNFIDLRKDLKQQIAATADLQEQFIETREELQKQIAETRVEFRQQITDAKKGLQNQILSLKKEVEILRKQEQRNFKMLEHDLGGALDGMQILNEMKVDKKKLRQAAI